MSFIALLRSASTYRRRRGYKHLAPTEPSGRRKMSVTRSAKMLQDFISSKLPTGHSEFSFSRFDRCGFRTGAL